MFIAFNKISVADFKSFFGRHTLDLSTLGAGLFFVRGQNLVEPALGSNGAGKTTILSDALTWCLFGQTLSGLRNTDVAPWGRKAQATVECDVGIADTEHNITRVTRTNGLAIDNDIAGQNDLLQLLGLTEPLFRHTIIIGQNQPLFFDQPPTEKLKVFTEALDLNRWDERSDRAKKYAADLASKLSETQGRQRGVTDQLAELATLVQSAKTKAKEWEDERAVLLRNSEQQIDGLRREHDATTHQRDEANVAYDGISVEVREIEHKRQINDKALKAALRARAASDGAITAAKHTLRELQTQLASITDAKKCPMCGQAIKSVTEINKHKKQISDKIKETERDVSIYESDDFNVPALTAEADALDKELAEHRALQRQESELLSVLTPRVAELSAQLQVLETALAEGQSAINPYTLQVRELQQRVRATTQKQTEIESEIGKLERGVTRAQYWIKGFKDIKLQITNEVMEELELATNTMLPEIGLQDWFVRYNVERETKAGTIKRGMNVEILSPYNDKAVKWESFSGGESQRLRLVGALALRDVLLARMGVECSLEVIDEGTRGIGGTGVRDLCQFLADRAAAHNRQIFIIDHLARESSNFASTLTVVKDRNGSRIEAGN